ncbi:MAG: type 2 lanthipeptide synthetase LanM [Lachnospiraceae bacterium]|jgi:type 2 lantibiotic biosynthesis protein LanM|nr:type 2 lanthipeptide synthetase LanM [Lachnospiraceae bacterium]
MIKEIEKILIQDKDFWQKYFGLTFYDQLRQNITENIIIPEIPYSIETENFLCNIQNAKIKRSSINYSFLSGEPFSPFYESIIEIYIQHRNINMNDFSLLRNSETMLRKVLYNNIQEIPMRVLIFEMRQEKDKGTILGKNSIEEYKNYCDNFLLRSNYIWQLCNTYKEMTRLIFTRLTYVLVYIAEMLKHIFENYNNIVHEICGGMEFNVITELKITGSDTHHNGRKVLQCLLDNGKRFVYKPRNMIKEIYYHAIYSAFCKKVGVPISTFSVINKDTYSISEYLEGVECNQISKVQNYYKCIGVHLFLCYLLHTGDIHQENMITSNGQPILADAETMPGLHQKHLIQNAEEQIREKLRWNVLHTGILPVPIWKHNKQGVVISVLHSDKEVYSSVKLPVIINQGTTDMKVIYDNIKIRSTSQIPKYHGKRTVPLKYIKEICEGFEKAYHLYLNEKHEIEEQFKRFWNCDIRFLIKHTQQYAVYQFASLHPTIMKSTQNHILMLQILQRNHFNSNVIKEEISDLINLDIPLLCCKGNSYVEHYQNSAKETHEWLISRVGENDLKQQLEYIKLSIKMMNFNQLQNKYFRMIPCYNKIDDINAKNTEKQIRNALKFIIQRLNHKAVIKNCDICWEGLKLEESNLWSIQPTGMNFYNGICGITVFLSIAHKYGYLDNHNLYNLAINKVCNYVETEEFQKETKTGIYVGSGSVLYALWILYQIEKDIKYLYYAKLAAKHIERVISQDVYYDLMAGNAGVVSVLINLYKESGENEYLRIAILAGDILLQKAVWQEAGMGFVNQESKNALGGMAHGNSGYIMAFASLLEITNEKKYYTIINELLEYENLAYSKRKGNWRDLRNLEKETYGNAWCHGAAGILLSRLKLCSLEIYAENSTIMQDIENAANILFMNSYRKGLCLCHGMSGNYLIMREYQKQFPLNSVQERIMRSIQQEIIKRVLSREIMPQDWHQMGFMTGIAGIGYCLCCMLK